MEPLEQVTETPISNALGKRSPGSDLIEEMKTQIGSHPEDCVSASEGSTSDPLDHMVVKMAWGSMMQAISPHSDTRPPCIEPVIRFSQGEKVEQHPSTLSVPQGSSSVINCRYSDSASEYFPWYKQEFGKGPQLLIDIRSTMATKEDQRFTVLLNRTAKHLSLHIADTQPEDSAVYFCAASTHCFPDSCYLHSNLGLGQPPVL
ncbi:PREDICTED: uncharacterized protein LOC101370416 [Odobenus rosmarus divergens]|uniref:Uncharacterized protein LOC101370416 n=1 Tax=Odobenus rosmarus divergens TaxID=9708 RepID=A0A9B0LQ76_ODORO